MRMRTDCWRSCSSYATKCPLWRFRKRTWTSPLRWSTWPRAWPTTKAKSANWNKYMSLYAGNRRRVHFEGKADEGVRSRQEHIGIREGGTRPSEWVVPKIEGESQTGRTTWPCLKWASQKPISWEGNAEWGDDSAAETATRRSLVYGRQGQEGRRVQCRANQAGERGQHQTDPRPAGQSGRRKVITENRAQ